MNFSCNLATSNNNNMVTIYILTIQPQFEHVTTKFSQREFVNPIKAETAFKEQCDNHNLEWSEQMDGSFSSIGYSDIEITLEVKHEN